MPDEDTNFLLLSGTRANEICRRLITINGQIREQVDVKDPTTDKKEHNSEILVVQYGYMVVHTQAKNSSLRNVCNKCF